METNPAPMQILLVEDSPTDRLMVTEALGQARLANRVHAVEDGVVAMAFLHREGVYADAPRPDLVLLDLNMPRKGGREVLAEVKADPALRGIPVVVFTSSTAAADVAGAYDLHANCYIAKPVNFDGFARVLGVLDHFWLEIATLPPRTAGGTPPPRSAPQPVT